MMKLKDADVGKSWKTWDTFGDSQQENIEDVKRHSGGAKEDACEVIASYMMAQKHTAFDVEAKIHESFKAEIDLQKPALDEYKTSAEGLSGEEFLNAFGKAELKAVTPKHERFKSLLQNYNSLA